MPRPLGASLADWLGMDRPLGIGVDFGTSAIFAALVCAALVGYLALSHPRAAHDTPGAQSRHPALIVQCTTR
ncbi:hypothetical protein [Streptomyces sp. NPDC054804]